jgi:NitT/TauT family transport system permease protein
MSEQRSLEVISLAADTPWQWVHAVWDRSRYFVLPAAAFLGVLVLWQLAVGLFDVPAVILPPPSAVLAQITQHPRILWKHTVPTTLEALLAFSVAVPFGVLLAVIITASKIARQTIYPNVILFQVIPKIALAPLFIVWLGIGTSSRVTFAVFISFFPVLISTATGLRSVSPEIIKLCHSVGARPWQVLWKVAFPTALPFIFNGMKITVTLSVIGIVVAEFIAAQAGLGFLILFASSNQQTDLCLAGVTVLCALGLLLYGIVAGAERLANHFFGEG